MRQYVQEITQVLHLMSEQELKDSIEQLCGYLLFKYGEYYIDDFDDDTTKPVFDTVRTGEYTIRLSGKTITCQNIHSNHGTLSLIPIANSHSKGQTQPHCGRESPHRDGERIAPNRRPHVRLLSVGCRV